MRVHKTDPFFDFHILLADGFFDLETLLFEIWLKQPSCLKYSIAQSLTRRYLLGAWWATVHGVARVGHDLATNHHHSTYKLIEHYDGMVMDVVGQPGSIDKQVCKGIQGEVKHVRTADRA